MLPILCSRRLRLPGSLAFGITASLLLLIPAFAGSSKLTPSTSKPVHVRQYTRKDGTVVSAHDRAAPGTATPRPRIGQPSTSSKAANVSPKSSPASTLAARQIPPKGTAATMSAKTARTSTTPTIGAGAASKSALRDANGRIERSAAAKSAFQKSHACPSTGTATGSCPGYIVDHVKPLACGGADAPTNMQWQTIAAAKEKDKTERAGCPGK